jgi:hypothetical protein
MAAPGSRVYEDDPEWLLGREGKDKLFCLVSPEARQWLADVLQLTFLL